MNIYATIRESTPAAAEGAIRRVEGVDGIELRIDGFDRSVTIDLAALRRASPLPMILTDRSVGGHESQLDPAAVARAVAAGFDLVDIEFAPGMTLSGVNHLRGHILLSYHDFEAAPDPHPLAAAMQALGVAAVKVALTPQRFSDNGRLLSLLDGSRHLTVIGMGDRGMYARILAPFFGSEMVFAVPDGAPAAAPGQLTVSRARAIYGYGSPQHPRSIFAVTGNPVIESGSPSIHNRRFRERALPAAYSILQTESFAESAAILMGNLPFTPTGLSITAPFKEEAFHFAVAIGADCSESAREAMAVNTLVRQRDRVIAGNSDVAGFEAAIAAVAGGAQKAALLGAGGTARAALVALRRAGISATIYNRTAAHAAELAERFSMSAAPLADLHQATGLLINTLPGAVLLDPGHRLSERFSAAIDVAYGVHDRLAPFRALQIPTFDGLQFLEAQAELQSQLFSDAIGQVAEVSR